MELRSKLVSFGLGLALVGCGGTQGNARSAGNVTAEWGAADKGVLDDGIDLSAVPNEPPAEIDDLNETTIDRRCLLAEGVFVGKVEGVTAQVNAGKTVYRVDLAPEGAAMVGVLPSDAPLSLTVDERSDLFGTVRAQEAKLIGRRWIVSYKRYAADDPSVPYVVHFHLSANAPAVRKAVEVAATKRAIRGR